VVLPRLEPVAARIAVADPTALFVEPPDRQGEKLVCHRFPLLDITPLIVHRRWKGSDRGTEFFAPGT
jgi:hypothetical protein